MTRPQYLVAVDMDGTLLRDDKTIAERDVLAIKKAAKHGIAVTIATGRLKTGALPTARAIGIQTPIVCADGGLLVDPVSGDSIDKHCISLHHAAEAVNAIIAHGLAPFVFLADAIHCDAGGAPYRSFIETWSKEIVVHPSLADAEQWKHPDGVSVTVGMGTSEQVERTTRHLQDRHADGLDTIQFGMATTSIWAVRSLPRGCDKATMLERLAGRMDIPRERVSAIGDWLNDIGMFRYAGRSFAMGQAPHTVKAAATDVLTSTSAEGGGLAEALDHLIAALPETRSTDEDR